MHGAVHTASVCKKGCFRNVKIFGTQFTALGPGISSLLSLRPVLVYSLFTFSVDRFLVYYDQHAVNREKSSVASLKKWMLRSS